MATEIVNLSATHTHEIKKGLSDPNPTGKQSVGTTYDEQGNILPYPSYKPRSSTDNYCQVSPIPRLAAAAAFVPRDQIPTAGGYGIDRSKEPKGDFPLSYLLYEDQPWVLGKLNRAVLDLPEPPEPVKIDMKRLDAILAKYETDEEKVNVDSTEAVGEKNAIETPATATVQETEAETLVEEKVAAAFTNVENKEVMKRSTPKKSSSPATRKSASHRTSLNKQKSTSKSPGRAGDAPAGKLVSSPRSGSKGPKKIVNAKVDVEIVEKKY